MFVWRSTESIRSSWPWLNVLTTVFAGTVGGGPHGGYGVANATVAHILAEAGSTPVGTGPCAAG